MGWKDILSNSPMVSVDDSNSNCPTNIPKIPKIRMLNKKDPEYFNGEVRKVITELNNRGVSLMDFPEATRHRAFLLEQQISKAVNAGDMASFDQCLTEWRRCFH